MIEQSKFLALLKEMSEVARVQENSMTKEEIAQYFQGLDVTEEQLEAVYQYLGENGIRVPGFALKQIEQPKEEDVVEAETEKKDEKEEKQSVAHRLYIEELESLEKLTEEEKTRLFLEVRNGSEEAKLRLMEGYLPVVVELAEKYKDKGMPEEDLIQEGNVGLLDALSKVKDIAKIEDADTFLIETIRQNMVEAVDVEIGENDWESTLLAKSNLINEAAKYLAEDLGRVATVQELSDYTKLTVQEILDIRNLSLDAIELGKGE